MNIWLTCLPPKNEVKQTIDKLYDDKATIPDGFTMRIFKAQSRWIWYVAGLTRLYMVRNIVKEMNHMFIMLIPKAEGTKRIEDFQVNLCMNSIYKIHLDYD